MEAIIYSGPVPTSPAMMPVASPSSWPVRRHWGSRQRLTSAAGLSENPRARCPAQECTCLHTLPPTRTEAGSVSAGPCRNAFSGTMAYPEGPHMGIMSRNHRPSTTEYILQMAVGSFHPPSPTIKNASIREDVLKTWDQGRSAVTEPPTVLEPHTGGGLFPNRDGSQSAVVAVDSNP